MKPTSASLAVLLLLSQSSGFAATKSFDVKMPMPVEESRPSFFHTHRTPTDFRMEVIGDNDGAKPETLKHGRPFVAAQNGETYSIRLYNPLPVRVAVNLTVDGLNSISGKPSGIEDGQKWLIEPYSFIVIRGWQVNGAEARRFYFTDKPKSYAKWEGERLGRDLAANCGVIGAAYFWSQEELARYYEQRPVYRSYGGYPSGAFDKDEVAKKAYDGASRAKAAAPQAAAEAAPQAGTGMGERESNPTTQVDFRYDAGMYRVSQAVLIYYDFAAPEPIPNPFPSLSYAPEMP
jgi:hypothetical protein